MNDSIVLQHTVTGDRAHPLVVFLHGFTGDARDWDDVIAGMSDTHCCLTVDLPGHGRTRVPADSPEHYEMPAAATALIELIDTVGHDTFSLVGYSMGGRLALYMTTIYAMRIDALVLESTSPGLKTRDERATRRDEDEARAVELETGDFDVFLARWYDHPLFAGIKDAPARFDALVQRRREQNPRELAKALRGLGVGNQSPLWDELPNHYVPTLAIAGEHDAKYRAIADEMASLCGDIRGEVAPGCSHNVHFQEPAMYTECLLRFLTSSRE